MRAPQPYSGKTAERGAALLVMLVIMVLGAAAYLVSSLSTSAQKTARQEKTVDALAHAKEALISRAVTDDNRPGELPCPDIDGDGKLTMGTDFSFGSPPLCTSFVGYLPWYTLKLPELRGGSNEKLWYALSTNFYAGNSTPLNSDTQGQLSITGNLTVSNVAAIVFAPGAPLCGKTHNSNNVADYLEAGDGTTTTYTLKSSSDDCNNSPYNDNLIAITASQLFQPVEKRIGGEIKSILNTYFTAWGAFPFTAPFADPSTSPFTGAAGTSNGLLPVGNTTQPAWNAIPTVSISGGTITGGPMECLLTNGGATNSRWRCCHTGGGTSCTGSNIIIPSGVTITITGTLNNVGFGLWRPHHKENVCEVRARNSSGTTVLATSLLDTVSVTGSLNSNGSANVVFQATGQSGGTTLQRIELRDISTYNTDIKTNTSTTCSPPSTSSPTIPKWLFNDATYGNNWHQLAYYAVSPGYAPGGGNTCNPFPGTPSCLTLGGSGVGSNKRAAVVMTGGALTGQARPPSAVAIADYLEGENASPDYIYENKTHSGTFNDQVIPVAP